MSERARYEFLVGRDGTAEAARFLRENVIGNYRKALVRYRKVRMGLIRPAEREHYWTAEHRRGLIAAYRDAKRILSAPPSLLQRCLVWLFGCALFLLGTAAFAEDCRDENGRFIKCPKELSEPVVVSDTGPKDCTVTGCPTKAQQCVEVARGEFQCLPQLTGPEMAAALAAEPKQRISIRAMAGGLTALATDTPASVKPLGSIGIEAPLSTSDRGPSLEVQLDLTALPGDTLDFSDPQTFNALELAVGLSQPIHPALLFRVYVDAGAASRLATSEEPVNRLPGWFSAGLLFRTADRAHHLKVGMGSDQRLSGEWAPTVHVSGQVKVGEKAGVAMYLVGSMIRALDLSSYGYAVPARDSLRIGVSVGM